jgi:hypothetical protein
MRKHIAFLCGIMLFGILSGIITFPSIAEIVQGGGRPCDQDPTFPACFDTQDKGVKDYNINTTANISAVYFLGNGSQLTDLVAFNRSYEYWNNQSLTSTHNSSYIENGTDVNVTNLLVTDDVNITDRLYVGGLTTHGNNIVMDNYLGTFSYLWYFQGSPGTTTGSIQGLGDMLHLWAKDYVWMNNASLDGWLEVKGDGNVSGDFKVIGDTTTAVINVTSDLINFADGTSLSTDVQDGDGFFVFDGVNDHAETAEDGWADGDNDGTISLWIRFNETDEYQNIAAYTTSGYGSANFQLRLDDYTNLTLAWNADSAGWNSLVSSSQITDNNWHHVVLTSDGSTTNEIWLDGVNSSFIEFTQASGGATSDWFSDIYQIGSYNHHLSIGYLDRSGTPVHPLNGSIDEVMYFNYSLPGTQITQIYNDDRNNGSYQGEGSGTLISHWRANANSADDDQGAHDMTLQSGADITVEINDSILEYSGRLKAIDYLYSSPFYVKDDIRETFKGMAAKPDSIDAKNPDWAELDHDTYGASKVTVDNNDYISLILLQQMQVKQLQDLIEWNEELEARIEKLEGLK